MYEEKTFLGIIPARGGSKRLPKKNILPLFGKPLIVWTIESALKSKYLDKIIVSSDNEEILSISSQYGIDIVKRPLEIASDKSKTIDVILHVLNTIKTKYDFIVLLQPTSPLRNEKHIDNAIEYLMNKKADGVISVCEVEHSPLWTNTLPDDNSMTSFLKDEIKNIVSQNLPKFYRLNGAIYITKVEKLIEEKTLFLKDNIFAFCMDQLSSIDIDTQLDLEFAEFLIKKHTK